METASSRCADGARPSDIPVRGYCWHRIEILPEAPEGTDGVRMLWRRDKMHRFLTAPAGRFGMPPAPQPADQPFLLIKKAPVCPASVHLEEISRRKRNFLHLTDSRRREVQRQDRRPGRVPCGYADICRSRQGLHAGRNCHSLPRRSLRHPGNGHSQADGGDRYETDCILR